jgi:membrane protein involved in colicin uptake
MVDFKLTNAYNPTLFTTDGYQLVVMPMVTDKANEQAKAEREAKAKAEPVAEAVTDAEAVAEAEAEVKPKRSRKSDKVAVA